MVEILIEIAREDEHIEEGEEGTHLGFVAEGEEHGESERDLDHARGHDDEVGEAVAESEPHGHLRHEGKAVESEVTEAGIGHEDAEQEPEEGFDVVHRAMKIEEVEYLWNSLMATNLLTFHKMTNPLCTPSESVRVVPFLLRAHRLLSSPSARGSPMPSSSPNRCAKEK